VIRTKPLSVTLADFETAWAKLQWPYWVRCQRAYAHAQTNPLPLGHAELGILAALCRNLADGDGTFFLSCAMGEALFGVDRKVIWRWLKVLQNTGLLQLVKKGKVGPGPTGQASLWKFLPTD
jgi:hypothetical protein